MAFDYVPVFRMGEEMPIAVTVSRDDYSETAVYERRQPCRNLSTEAHMFHCSACDAIIGHDVSYCPICGSKVVG